MWSFTYKHGDRPLEGYTIQRAAGRGGFGEVYYAISDAGREVALKVILGYEQIELRGITQCMNLKSPHLVSIFDVKYNAEGKPFVIMEYVNGPNLRQLLDAAPDGLGEQKAAFFLREIAKGLTYLHDNGIVHRDLKPANIFFEDGLVKIGDYGLSKAIATTQHSAQTVTVGTVHYMAPEVGVGKYDRGIDIYALGALLFEMLTGSVPFAGASPTEVLMKHLSAEPDVRGLSEPFATVVRRAMAKDPQQRFQSVQEMVEALYGADHIRDAVSVFAPNDLSMVAGRAARFVGAGSGSGGSGSGPVGVATLGGFGSGQGGASASASAGDVHSFTPSSTSGQANNPSGDVWGRVAGWADELGGQFNPSRTLGALDTDDDGQRIRDPLAPRHRVLMALAASGAVAMIGTLVAGSRVAVPIVSVLFVLLAVWGLSLGSLLAAKLVLPRMRHESNGLQRLACGGIIVAAAAIVSLPAWATSSVLSGTLLAVVVPFCFIDLKRWTAADRDDRVIWELALYTGIAAMILSGIFDGSRALSIATVVGASIVLQLLAPWEPPPYRRLRRREERAAKNAAAVPPPIPAAAAAAAAAPRQGGVAVEIAAGGSVRTFSLGQRSGSGSEQWIYRPVSLGVRRAWRYLATPLLAIAGIAALAYGTQDSTPGRDSVWLVVGGCLLIGALLALVQSFRSRSYSGWSYIGRPAVLWAAAWTIITSGYVLGNVRGAPEPLLVTLMAIAGVSAVGAFLFGGARRSPQSIVASAAVSPLFRSYALLFASLQFLGLAGMHRFYAGRTGTGIVWLLTFGLAGIGQVVDVILLLLGRFRDADGRRLLRWDRRDNAEYAPEPVPSEILAAAGVPPLPASSATASSPTASPSTASPASDSSVPGIDSSAPASESGASKPSRSAARRRSRRAVRSSVSAGLSGLMSGVGALLLTGGFVTALAAAIDAPGLLASGLVGAEPRRAVDEFWNDTFGDGASQSVLPDAPVPAIPAPPPPPAPAVLAVPPTPPVPAAGTGRSNMVVRALHPGQLPMLLRPEQMSMEELVTAAQYWGEVARELNDRLSQQQPGSLQGSIPTTPPTPGPLIEEARRRVRESDAALDADRHGGPGAASAARSRLAEEAERRVRESHAMLDADRSPVPTAPPAPSGDATDDSTGPAITRSERRSETIIATPGGVRVEVRRGDEPLEARLPAAVAAERREWTEPLRAACAIVSVLLMLAGLTLLTFARRPSGGLHVVRGVVGTLLLFGALLPLRAATLGGDLWINVESLTRAEAVRRVTQELTSHAAAPVAAMLFVVALVVLSWPARTRELEDAT
jgi:serine/threonine protein kinase